jgi:hypothetical protein
MGYGTYRFKMVKKKTTKKSPVTKTLKKGVKKKLMGKTPVTVLQDHGDGLVTVSIGGKYVVVRRSNLK